MPRVEAANRGAGRRPVHSTASAGEWPSGKAADSGSANRRFESSLPSQYWGWQYRMNQSFEKLISLLRELFQLDQPDLDFGFYRVMHARATEITSFLEDELL